MPKNMLTKRIIAYEMVGFGLIMGLLWIDEIFDIPRLFGAEATPINWVESIFETVIVFALCIFIVIFSWKFLKRIKYLEGFLPVCSFCKRIRVGTDWFPIEKYVTEHSEAEFSHGLCPECAEKYYKDFVRKS
ncbi:MAG: hypothetical protein AB1610_09100 [Nitrospirota bacterium]